MDPPYESWGGLQLGHIESRICHTESQMEIFKLQGFHRRLFI